jgi:hypothetical protein
MQTVQYVVVIADLVNDRLTAIFDPCDFLTEFLYLAAGVAKILDGIIRAAPLVPEQVRGANNVQFLQRMTNPRQDVVLMIFLRQLPEFCRSSVQVPFKILQVVLGTLDLFPK